MGPSMGQSTDQTISTFLRTPVSRRAALYLGAKGALATCTALGLFGSLWGCYRAPGTGREQLIFISEEKEIAMGVRAFRDVLRGTRLNENPEINELVQREIGRASCRERV